MPSVYPSPKELLNMPSMKTLSMYPEMIDCDYERNFDCNYRSNSETIALELELDCLTKQSVNYYEQEYGNQCNTPQGDDNAVSFHEEVDQDERMQLELSPGVTTHYRFATETMDAYKRGQTVIHKCIACGSKLHIVNDAEFVICPVDNIIQPIDAFVAAPKGTIGNTPPKRGLHRESGVHHIHQRLLNGPQSPCQDNEMRPNSFRDQFVKSYSSFRVQKPKIGGIGLGILDIEHC